MPSCRLMEQRWNFSLSWKLSSFFNYSFDVDTLSRERWNFLIVSVAIGNLPSAASQTTKEHRHRPSRTALYLTSQRENRKVFSVSIRSTFNRCLQQKLPKTWFFFGGIILLFVQHAMTLWNRKSSWMSCEQLKLILLSKPTFLSR